MINASQAADSAWRPHEAQVLAALLRSTRVTVLYGTSGPATTALLRAGVLPLLRSEPSPSREVVIDFDEWNEAPLAALAVRLREALPWVSQDLELADSASLAERVALLHERLGASFLFVFDRFEDFLDAPRDREDLRAFSHALVEAANQPGLPANFLIALREEAKPLLKRLRRRIPGLAQHGLRLSSHDDGSLELLPVLEQDADLRSRSATPDSLHPAMKTQDVYASIEALLSKAADASREAPWQGPPGEPAPEATDSEMPAVWRDSRSPSPMHAEPTQPAAAGPHAAAQPWRSYAIAAAVVLPLLLAAWMLGERAGRPASDPDARPAAALMRFVLTTEADASTDARVAAELARQLAGGSGVELGAEAAPEGVPAWTGLAGPQLAIVRADALQAARDAGGPALRIVTSLFAEEVHVVVRADSPLKSLQQLKGKRINIGPAAGARARTATRLYGAMFGARLPASAAGALPLDAALRQLLERKGLDAMILIDGQPSAWLAAQNPETLRAMRVLTLGDKAQMSFLVASAAYDDANPDAMGRFAHALCRALPALRRDGHPKWLEMRPGWQEDAGWPYSPSAVRGFRACLAEGSKR